MPVSAIKPIHPKRGKPRRHLFFKAVLFIARIIYPRHKAEGCNYVLANEPAVFVCNHEGAYGPVTMQLFFPYKYRPWVLDRTILKDSCRKHLEENFFKEDVGLREPLNKWAAAVIAPICVRIMRAVQAIPVFRNSAKVLFTFRKSVDTLIDGCNLVIFPEIRESNPVRHVRRFYTGFVYIAEKYYRKAGKLVLFYPVYCNRIKRTISIGRPIGYLPENGFGNERERICGYLHNSMEEMALAE
jgi:1-acyl-sn-glycerol-3-phosphate acyltransferase